MVTSLIAYFFLEFWFYFFGHKVIAIEDLHLGRLAHCGLVCSLISGLATPSFSRISVSLIL